MQTTMRWPTRTRMICALGAVGFASIGQVSGGTFPNNPYHSISERNVFGLKPVSPIHVEQPNLPLPKVVLTGITTILKGKRALLKVQFPAKPQVPAKEESYILAEGQRDGPIEVLKINETNATVTVDNAGTVTTITVEKLPPTPPPPVRRLNPYWSRPAMTALRR